MIVINSIKYILLSTLFITMSMLAMSTQATVLAQGTGDAPPAQSQGETIDSSCDTADTLTKENCTIVLYLANGIKFLTALAFMAIIASVMFGGYQYMSARDNAGTVEAARKRITWAFVALGLLIFANVFLQWVVPGGVF